MLVAVVATGLHLLHHQPAQPVLQWALTLHVDPGNYYVRTLLAKLLGDLGDLGVRSCNNTFRLTRREAMQNARPARMPRKQCNWPVKVRRGELSVHPASEDPVLRGDSQDSVDRENFRMERIANSQAVLTRNP